MTDIKIKDSLTIDQLVEKLNQYNNNKAKTLQQLDELGLVMLPYGEYTLTDILLDIFESRNYRYNTLDYSDELLIRVELNGSECVDVMTIEQVAPDIIETIRKEWNCEDIND